MPHIKVNIFWFNTRSDVFDVSLELLKRCQVEPCVPLSAHTVKYLLLFILICILTTGADDALYKEHYLATFLILTETT